MMPEKKKLNLELIHKLIANAPDSEDLLMNWGETQDKALKAAVQAIWSRFNPDAYRKTMEQIWYDFYLNHSKEYLRAMVEQRHDGFIIQRTDSIRHFICFNSEILTIITT